MATRSEKGSPAGSTVLGSRVEIRGVIMDDSAASRVPGESARLPPRPRLTEDLAGAVADAINNPLTALLGTVEMALETPRLTRQTLERVYHLAQRIGSVVDGTLALFRSRGRRDLPVDLAALIETCAREVGAHALAERVTIETKVEAGLPRISADAGLLSMALTAMAENALEAMQGDGQLWLDAEAAPARGTIELRVSDTGTGIPEHVRERVFEPFFSTGGGRTGLGLAIALSAVREHGGQIRIAERAGGGALLTIELPRT